VTFSCSQAPGQALVTLSSADPVGLDGLTLALDSLLADPHHAPDTPILIDLITLSDAHVAQAITLAQHLGSLPMCRGTRLALLVSGLRSTVLERALTMYLSHEGLAARLFTDATAARAWLLDGA